MKQTKSQTLPMNKALLIALLLVPLLAAANKPLVVSRSNPNIILFFVDDLGYGDLGCYESKKVKTPHIDRLAAEGLRATDFFVPANVCGPSRAALLTGRYPMRCGNPISRLDFPKYAQYGLAAEEITSPEILKTAGYQTMMVGKWHLGLLIEGSHPLDAGFDDYLGIRSNYANRDGEDILYQGRDVLKKKVTSEELAERYTDEIVRFVQEPKDAPFFIYASYHISHRPHTPSAPFKGVSGKGKYADFIEELDHCVGRVLQAITDQGLDEETLIVFVSDNGPAKEGSAGVLSGGKYVTMEGGHRVPGIFRWTGQIPAGQKSDVTMTSMDLLPLFADLARAELPTDRTIDGKNIIDVLSGKSQQSPHEFIYYYNGLNLQAVRKGQWKLHLPRTLKDQPFWAKKAGGNRMKINLSLEAPLLFNLNDDRGEKTNLAQQNPEVVVSLMNQASLIRKELGDVNVTGTDQRPHGLVNPNEKK